MQCRQRTGASLLQMFQNSLSHHGGHPNEQTRVPAKSPFTLSLTQMGAPRKFLPSVPSSPLAPGTPHKPIPPTV